MATAVETVGEEIKNARLALGGVAHKPWRAIAAEEYLVGKPATKESFSQAAKIALQDAKPLTNNSYKIDLTARAIRRALAVSAQGGGVV